ncbi:MAG: hypothetical protein KJ949_00695 [Nanoarchaeota archaeon]|nr:hypothetical protein [Nanoarchaeota archaeon]
MENKENWFKQKKTTAGFAVLALVGSFFSINTRITGNVILTNSSNFNLLNLIGLLLFLCSIILAAYSIRKK